jgi:hypothetical protein
MMVGFGAGYYLGAKAGRERYQQLNAMIGKVKRSDAYEEATDKARAVVDLSVERAKDFVVEHTPMGGHSSDINGDINGDIIAVPSPS